MFGQWFGMCSACSRIHSSDSTYVDMTLSVCRKGQPKTMAADARLWRPNEHEKLYISRQSFPTLQDSENGIAILIWAHLAAKTKSRRSCLWLSVKLRENEENLSTTFKHPGFPADLWCSQCRSNFAKRIKQCKKESGLWVFWRYWSVLSGSLHDPIRAAFFSTILSGFSFTFHSGKHVAKFDQYRSIIKYDIPTNGSKAFKIVQAKVVSCRFTILAVQFLS